LPGEGGCAQTKGDFAALGVARRWSFQQVGAIPGVRVAADAELYNRQELSKLAVVGAEPDSPTSLAELLAHLYLQRGAAFVELLDGAFSIAVWDERARKLVLAIDRLGVNSLYWRQEPGRLLFASRVGGIRAILEGSAEVNPAALMQYMLFSAVPAPLTIYHGVEKLRPGHLLIYENGAISQKQYWDLEYPEDESHDEAYWAREVREGMRSAVHRQLLDCVPERTGEYLSGGTDSSSVVAFASERHTPTNTFSIFFSEGPYSEIAYARITAQRFGTRHHELCLAPEDGLDAVPRIAQYYDEPFANSSAIGSYCCARLARDAGVETLLAGDGGDELFGGNERYASDKRFALYQAVPKALRLGLIEPIVGLLPENDGRLSLPKRYVRRARISNPLRILSYGLFLSTPPADVFEPDFLAAAPPERWMDIASGHFLVASNRSELNRLLYLDVKMTLADNDLRKVLGTAEMAGVRARFPLLDYRLAELSGRIPSRLKLKGFQKRYIFKRAMKDILPAEVLRKKKHGFGVPMALWFLQDERLDKLVKDVLNDPRTRQRGYFRPEFFDQVMRQHREEDAKNYGEILWYLVALELWHREHCEAKVGSACVR
jgi:asparagine synthase (glutamine-hydrolysing)